MSTIEARRGNAWVGLPELVYDADFVRLRLCCFPLRTSGGRRQHSQRGGVNVFVGSRARQGRRKYGRPRRACKARGGEGRWWGARAQRGAGGGGGIHATMGPRSLRPRSRPAGYEGSSAKVPPAQIGKIQTRPLAAKPFNAQIIPRGSAGLTDVGRVKGLEVLG